MFHFSPSRVPLLEEVKQPRHYQNRRPVDQLAEIFRFPRSTTPPPRKNVHRTTFFTVIGPSNRPLMCAAYDVKTGIELYLSYADDNVMRSQLFRDVDREEQTAAAADAWRLVLIEQGIRLSLVCLPRAGEVRCNLRRASAE
jgi:hypothetical protein